MLVLLTACSSDDEMMTDGIANRQSRGTASEKTVLVYMAGKNDLSTFLDMDLDEMKQGSMLIGDSDNLIVFVRRNDEGEQPWLARIKNGEVTDSVSLSDMGIRSSDGQNRASDPAIMEGVMRYAYSHYPAAADGYGLVFWGHGSGWLMDQEVGQSRSRAYGYDNGHSGQEGRWLNIPTMAGILNGLPHLKFILFDCCNMMCLENLYELRNAADYIIGSPAEIPDCGAPYDQIVPDMFADGNFYSRIIDKYYASVRGDLPLTAVQTSEMDNLTKATRHALQTIVGNASKRCAYPDMTGIIHYYYTVKETEYHPENSIFYDAGDFFLHHAPQEVYRQWKQALDRAVVERRIATRWSTDKVWYYAYTDFTVTEAKMHGVSMFVPQDPARGDYARYNEDIKQMAWYKNQ